MFFAQVVLLLYTCGIASSKSEVVLTPKGSFKIAIFSDLHYGENEDSFGIVQDERSATLMTDVLAQEQPNLSVLLGDLITGENTFAFNSSEYLDKIVEPLVEGGYGWASVYGNHDSKYNLTRRALLRAELKYQNSHTQGGPPGTDGTSNYMIPLYDSSGTTDRSTQNNLADEDFGNAPLGLLYFLDSRGGSEGDPSNNDNVPNFVSARTAAWLYETSQVAREQWGVLPSLAFVHIPIQAFLDSQKNAQFDIGGSHFPGLNADAPLARQGDGCVGRDRCSYEGQDIPFMQALLQIEGLHSVYSGHDHGDSFCGLWPDETDPSKPALNFGDHYASNGRPFLCFAKHSGFGGYGGWNRGVRQIQLDFGDDGAMRVSSWVRMQSDHAKVVTNVTLNSTYGQDEYPTDDGGWRLH